MKTPKLKDTLNICFAALTIISGFFLIPQTLQYIEFYRALQQMSIKVYNISFSLEPNMTVQAELTLINPSAYDKFVLEEIKATLFFEGYPHEEVLPWGPYVGTPYQKINTTWWKISAAFLTVNTNVPKHGQENFTLQFSVYYDKQVVFVKFYEEKGQYQPYIVWRMKGVAILSTSNFMEKLYIQFDETYPKTEE